jgi:hypothetical protein
MYTMMVSKLRSFTKLSKDLKRNPAASRHGLEMRNHEIPHKREAEKEADRQTNGKETHLLADLLLQVLGLLELDHTRLGVLQTEITTNM